MRGISGSWRSMPRLCLAASTATVTSEAQIHSGQSFSHYNLAPGLHCFFVVSHVLLFPSMVCIAEKSRAFHDGHIERVSSHVNCMKALRSWALGAAEIVRPAHFSSGPARGETGG